MNSYRIRYEKQAKKFIESRNPIEQKRILSTISKLPDGTDIVKMQGFERRYRLRIGDYRIIYDKYDSYLLIIIVKIGNRGDVYK